MPTNEDKKRQADSLQTACVCVRQRINVWWIWRKNSSVRGRVSDMLYKKMGFLFGHDSIKDFIYRSIIVISFQPQQAPAHISNMNMYIRVCVHILIFPQLIHWCYDFMIHWFMPLICSFGRQTYLSILSLPTLPSEAAILDSCIFLSAIALLQKIKKRIPVQERPPSVFYDCLLYLTGPMFQRYRSTLSVSYNVVWIFSSQSACCSFWID